MNRIEKGGGRFWRVLAVTATMVTLLLALPAVARAGRETGPEETGLGETGPGETGLQEPGIIRGSVQDSSGNALVGATVSATQFGAPAPAPVETTTSDKRGEFALSNLPPATYSLKVQLNRYTTVVRYVDVAPGATKVVKVTLLAAPDIPWRSSLPGNSEAIIARLREERGKQPLLRYLPLERTPLPTITAIEVGHRPFDGIYSGFLQIFSSSIQTPDGPVGTMGSQFLIMTPVASGAKLTLRGQFSELSLINGIEADVDFPTSDRRRSQIGLTLRQIELPGKRTALSFSREVKFHYGEQIQWARNVDFEYDAEFGTVDAYSSGTYFRPRMSMAWLAGPNTTVRVGVTKQDPEGTVNRWRDGFDNTVFWPYARGQRLHGEVTVAQLSRTMSVAFAAFTDSSETQSLFAVKPTGDRKLIVFDGRPMSTGGMRAQFNRDFDGFSAGVAYTNATGIGLGGGRIWNFNELVNLLKQQRFQMLTARFHGRFRLTNTELTAVYRMISGMAALPIDPYQTFAESNEPTLSIMVAQEVPVLRPFGGRIQAILDARNIFEPSLNNSPRYQLAQAPRLVKGGVNIRF